MSVHAVQRRGGRSWKVCWREGGHQRSKTFRRKSDAQEFDARMTVAKQRGSMGPAASDMTIAELAEQWMRMHVVPNLRLSTAKTYAHAYDTHIGPYLGEVKLNAFGTFQVSEFQRDLFARARYGMATKVMTALSGMFTKAAEWGFLDVNPVRQIKRPPRPAKEPVVPISPRQVEQLITWFTERGRERDALMVELLAYSGLRPGELKALRWADVKKRTITVWRAFSGDEVRSTKTGARRTVKLLAPLRTDLVEYRRRCGQPDDEALIFTRDDGSFIRAEDWKNWQTRWFAEAAAAVGLPWTAPYNLRHSFASLLIHSDMSVPEIASHMGHSIEMLLSTYAHVIDEFAGSSRIDPEAVISRARGQGVADLLPDGSVVGGGEGEVFPPEWEAEYRTRTDDPFLTMEVLYQLS